MHWLHLVSNPFHLEASSLMLECHTCKWEKHKFLLQISRNLRHFFPFSTNHSATMFTIVSTTFLHRGWRPMLDIDHEAPEPSNMYVFPVRTLLRASAPRVNMMKGAPEQTSNQI